MSRVGNKPIPIPGGVQVSVETGKVRVKGPKGDLVHSIGPRIGVKLEGGNMLVTREGDDRQIRAMHGVTRAHLNNMVVGVSQGYQKTLEITGVGFRAQAQGRN